MTGVSLYSEPSWCVRVRGLFFGSIILQFSQTFLQTLQLCIPVFTLATTGTALHKLHLHGQLAKLKVLAFLAQIHAATDGAVLRAEGCRACHPQSVSVERKKQKPRHKSLFT